MNLVNIEENNVKLGVIEGDLTEVNTPDGVGYYPMAWLLAEVNDVVYINPSHIIAKTISFEDDEVFLSTKDICNRQMNRIKEHGFLDLDKWEEYHPEPQESLEERWKNDFLAERG